MVDIWREDYKSDITWASEPVACVCGTQPNVTNNLNIVVGHSGNELCTCLKLMIRLYNVVVYNLKVTRWSSTASE